MTDRIVYLLITEPGGQDGLDRDDKGGIIVAASFDPCEIDKRKGLDSRYRIEKRIVSDSDTYTALAKLNKLDRLLLGIK